MPGEFNKKQGKPRDGRGGERKSSGGPNRDRNRDGERDRKPSGNRYGESTKPRPPFAAKPSFAKPERFGRPDVRDMRRGDRFDRERLEPADDVCWGRQPVLDMIKNYPTRCAKLIIANNVRPPYLDELTDAARAGRVIYQLVEPEALEKLCPGVRHQGVGCRMLTAEPVELTAFLKSFPKDKRSLIVVLDHIEDPHNLGAIVRSAEAAGASAVVYPKRRSALPGGTAVKTSAGASLRLPLIAVTNIVQTIEELKDSGFWVSGLEMRGKTPLWGEQLNDRLALVVGSEGEGLSRLVAEKCDQLLSIPISGKVGSLNASVAAALGMFEWQRSRKPENV